jgi:hypothetical protein
MRLDEGRRRRPFRDTIAASVGNQSPGYCGRQNLPLPWSSQPPSDDEPDLEGSGTRAAASLPVHDLVAADNSDNAGLKY